MKSCNFIKTMLILALLSVGFGVVSAQLRVNPSGDTYVTKNVYLDSSSGFLGKTGNFPVIFKVNGSLAGSTGNFMNTNVSFGFESLSNLSGGSGYDTAIGYQALFANSSGNNNTATGAGALVANTFGSWNTATGSCALQSNLGGNYNTATGYLALQANTNGNCNTAHGVQSLYFNTSGSYNTTHGYYTLLGNTTGWFNTAIGYYADVNSSYLSNATAIGHGAIVDESDKVVIGNTSVAKIGGYKSWTTYPSDRQAKKNIQTNVPGLDFINRLQPVTYNLDLDVVDKLLESDDPKINARRDSLHRTLLPEAKEIMAKARANKEKQVYSGFIAQDVEKTAKSMGYDFSGVDAPENGKGSYGLRYAEFVVPLVKAVQELSEQVNELKAEIAELKLAPQLRSAEVVIDKGGAMVIEQQAKLYQNTPNPFNQSTQIQFYVPETVNKALLCIYDLQGKQLKQTVITQRGYGIETVFASEFPAGIYLYALLANGDQVDVKRMILTE